jgi:hypothetical protein
MTENFNIGGGQQPPHSAGFIDNRIQIFVDPKRVETWELMVLETSKINDALLVFARYLTRGEQLISPNLPGDPIDELTPEQLQQIKNSEAFKILKRFPIPELQGAIKSFVAQATAGF